MKHSLSNISLLSALALSVAMVPTAHAQGVKNNRYGVPYELVPALEEAQTVDMQTTQTIAQDPSISVTSVNHVSLDTLGLYDAKQGGMDFKVWQGTNHARVKQLLQAQPDVIAARSVRKVLARLLMSVTNPPESENIQQNVLAERVNTLLALGETSQAARLLGQIPDTLMTEKLAQLKFTSHLLSGDDAWVCNNVNDALSRYESNAPEWQQLVVYCHANAGRQAEMQLAMNLLEEQQNPLDPALVEAFQLKSGYLQTASGDVRLEGNVGLLQAAMLALSGLDAYPQDYVETAPLPVLELIANQEALPEALRNAAQARIRALHAGEGNEAVELAAWLQSQWGDYAQPVSVHALAERLFAQSGTTPQADVQKAVRFRIAQVAQAMGYGLAVEDVQPWSTTPLTMPQTLLSPQALDLLEQAVADELEGEAVLLLGLLAGQAGPLDQWSAETLSVLVQSLQGLGLEADAKALASEAVVAQLQAAQ